MNKIKLCFVVAALALAPLKAKADSLYFMGESTPTVTAVLLVTGAGQFTAAQISSATAAGDFCVWFDSASVSGIVASSQGTAAAPRIGDVTATATNASYTLPFPRSFSNGLVALCKGIKSAYTRITQ